jgi:GTP-binding protein
VLLYLIPADTPDVKKAFMVLRNELKRYNPELMDKDFVVALSKCDLLDDELRAEYREEMAANFADIPHFMISSVAQTGLQALKDGLWKILNPA